MFPRKYFALIFIVSYFFIKSSAGENHQPNGLEQFFGDQTNFLIKAKLNFEGSEKSEWLIEESIFGDEKNSIVTSITQESGGSEIKVFRDFKTQNISLICVQNNCYRNGKFWRLNLNSPDESLAIFSKQILLMGPYRIISYFANDPTSHVHNLDIEGFSQFHLYFYFADPGSRILMRRKNFGQISMLVRLSETDNFTSLMPVLSIIQIEPLESSMVSLPSKYIHYEFNESITRYAGINITENTTNQHIVTLLDPVSSLKVIGEQSYREVVHDYEFDSKYISSGFNECTVELSVDKINYMTSEKYGIEFVKDLYFPESYVESFSSNLGMKVEYNKRIDNVEFDLVVTTYSRPVLELHESSRIHMNITDILKDFCLLLNLYSKSGSHEPQFDLIEVRKKCFIDVMELSAEDEWLQMITNMDNACFKNRNDKIILHLKILFLDRSVPRKIRDFSSHIQNIKHELRRMIMNKLSISYLRINQIKLDFFNAYTIMAKVEIVESFVTHLKTKIQGTAHRFRIKSTGSGIYSSTIDECVRLQGSKAKNKFIITCETGDYLCLGIDHENSLPAEDTNGLNCMLYNISTTNLSIDVSLKEIRKSYRNLNGSLFYAFRGSAFVVFGVTDVSPVKPASNIFSKYFYLITIFLFIITIIFCLIMILLCKLCKHKIHVLVDSVSLEALNSRK